MFNISEMHFKDDSSSRKDIGETTPKEGTGLINGMLGFDYL